MKYSALTCFTFVLAVTFPISAFAADNLVTDSGTDLTLVSDDFQLADGAAWDGHNRLYVPDVKAKQLLTFNLAKPDEPAKTRLEGFAISGCCFQLGQLYISDNGNSRIAILGKNGPPLAIAQFDPKLRPNDLVVDANGNVYVTITREGVVRRIDATNLNPGNQHPGNQHQKNNHPGQGRVVVKNLVTPNGIALSPDGSTLYVSSAKEGTISKVTIAPDAEPDAAEVWPTETFAQLESTDDGFRGDGMCVDRAGNVYCTGAASVSVFNSQGKLIDKITPPQRPINVILGGSDGRTLYISTFGGLYQQRVKAYGVSPNPPITATEANDKVPSTAIPANTRADLNVVYANIDGRQLLMDIFIPNATSSASRPAVVVVHGGGWLKGDKTKFRPLALKLAAKGYVTAAIEYRLGFEKHFPAAIRDCNAATSYLRKNAAKYTIDPNRIAAVGGSAGAHLVGLMAAGSQLETLRHPNSAQASSELQAAVVMAGPLQIATGSVADRSHDLKSNSNAVNWIGNTIDDAPQMYSLADALEKIDSQMPPTLFVVGSLDNPQRNAPAREKMKAQGVATKIVIHEGQKHGHWNRAESINQVVDDISDFLREHL